MVDFRSTRSNLTTILRWIYNIVYNIAISNAVFGFVLSIIVPEIMEGFRSDVRHSRKLEDFALFCP